VESTALFGTSGIRGDGEKLFTPQFCFDIGRSFVIFLERHQQNGSIAIGMDPRGTSPKICKYLTSGIIYEGREVFDEGATSVPSMNHIVKISEAICASIMVSGSHIQPHLNGVKFFAFDEEILKIHESEITEIYHGIKNKVAVVPSRDTGIHNELRAKEEYQNYLLGHADKNYTRWKVVVDAGDGAQSDTMPQVLKLLELDIVEMNTTIQGEFYSRDTENFEDYKDLQKKVVDEKADFGIGYDSDGDRCIFIDERGEFIPGDYTGTLLAKEAQGDVVVTTIATSQVIDKIGKTIVRTKVGSPFVVDEMKKKNANFGFEPNGGSIFNEMHSRDGGRTTIEILNLLRKSDMRLSQLVDTLPKFYISKTKIEYEWEKKEDILRKCETTFEGKRIEKMDGLKIWMDDDTWILFRSSMNAPEFRVFSESNSKKKSEDLLQKGIQIVKEVVNK
jgi:phosphomannomutase/phosphoglucomutase